MGGDCQTRVTRMIVRVSAKGWIYMCASPLRYASGWSFQTWVVYSFYASIVPSRVFDEKFSVSQCTRKPPLSWADHASRPSRRPSWPPLRMRARLRLDLTTHTEVEEGLRRLIAALGEPPREDFKSPSDHMRR